MTAPTRTNGSLAVLATLAGSGVLVLLAGLGVQFAIVLVGVAYLGIGVALLSRGGPVRDLVGSAFLHLGLLTGTVGLAVAATDEGAAFVLVGLCGVAVAGVAVGVTTRADAGVGGPILGGLVAGSALAFVGASVTVAGRVVLGWFAGALGTGWSAITGHPVGWMVLATVLLLVVIRSVPSAIQSLLLLASAPRRDVLYPQETRERVRHVMARLSWAVGLLFCGLVLTIPEGAWGRLLSGLPEGVESVVPNPGAAGLPSVVGDPGALRLLAIFATIVLVPLGARWLVRRIDRTRFRSMIGRTRYAAGGFLVALVILLALGPFSDRVLMLLSEAPAELLTAGLDSFGLLGVVFGLTMISLLVWSVVVGLALAVHRSGVLPRRSAAIAGGVAALFLAALLSTLVSVPTAGVVFAVIASLAAWDLGEHAADLGASLAPEADTAQVELVHAAGTLAVAVAAAVVTWLVARFGGAIAVDGEAALLAAILGSVGLALVAWLLRST